MDYLQQIQGYRPQNIQEQTDKVSLLHFVHQYRHNVLLRENTIAHITSSGFIVNEARDKVLLAHHNIMDIWAWPGGHADGDTDLLGVALREAEEETGLAGIVPLSPGIASLDILTVKGHSKNGRYIGAHLHLSVAYLLVGDETRPICSRAGENTAVAWFPLEYFAPENFNSADLYLYKKLIARAEKMV